MRVLVLWADHRSPNLGVRALAAGSEALVRQVWPQAEVDVQNFGRGASPLPIGATRSLVKEFVTRKAGVGRWLASYDVVVDTRSGDSFTDIYGLTRLRAMSTMTEWATFVGTPVVLGPQTIGPFEHRVGSWLGRRAIRQARAVIARDPVSAAYAARELGRPVDALATDVVFALPQPAAAEDHDVLLNVSGLLWHGSPHVDAPAYRDLVVDLLGRLRASGRRVSLLAHVLDNPSVDNDVSAAWSLAATHSGDVEVVVPTSLDDVRQVIASSRLVIGSRMHACLNALSVGTPAIPLAYSRKFTPLMDSIDWPFRMDLRAGGDLATDTLRFSESPELVPMVAQTRARAADLLSSAREAIVVSVA